MHKFTPSEEDSDEDDINYLNKNVNTSEYLDNDNKFDDNNDNENIDITSHANNSDREDTHTVDGHIETSEFANLISSKIAIEEAIAPTYIANDPSTVRDACFMTSSPKHRFFPPPTSPSSPSYIFR